MPVEIAVALIAGGVTLLNVLLSALMNYLSRKQQKKENEQNNQIEKLQMLEDKVTCIANGIQSLLRAEIIHAHEKWKNKGYCPVWAREALTKA